MAESDGQQSPQQQQSDAPAWLSLVRDGKNMSLIRCQRCPCLIMSPMHAKHVKKQLFLPHMKIKSENQSPEDGETLQDFWVVDNMYTFDNVGFSNTVGTIKYLICADCEVGPIGLHDLTDKNAFYLAMDRVRYDK